MVCAPRSLVVAVAVANVACVVNPFDELLNRPVCDTVDTDEVCREGSGGVGGTWLSSSTGDGSSSSASGSSGSSSSGGTEAGSSSGGLVDSTGPTAVCGDGVVEEEEECDDANEVDDDRCAVNCTKNRWVFSTSELYNTGDLNGIAGADSYCRQYALQSGRADDSWTTFIAWLSDSEHDVRDRLYRGRGRYVRTDNTVVVHDVEQFFSGTLAAPISVDEHGMQTQGGVITGTQPDGTRAVGTHCENWTIGSGLDFSAYIGGVPLTNAGWTLIEGPANPQPCTGLAAHLYCIEGK